MDNRLARTAKVTGGKAANSSTLRVPLFDIARMHPRPLPAGCGRYPDGRVQLLLESSGLGPKEVQAQREKYDKAMASLRKMDVEVSVSGGEKDRPPSLMAVMTVSERQAARVAEHHRMAGRSGFRLSYEEKGGKYKLRPQKFGVDAREIGDVVSNVSQVVKDIESGARESEIIWRSLREGKSSIPLRVEGEGVVVEVPTADRSISMSYYSLARGMGYRMTLSSDKMGKRYRIIVSGTDEKTLEELDGVVDRLESEMGSRKRKIARRVEDLDRSTAENDTPEIVATSLVKQTERLAALGLMALGQSRE